MSSRHVLRLAVLLLVGVFTADASAEYRSHPPTRPLPQASHRAHAQGPVHHADASRGNDSNPGSETKPWRTLAHAVQQLRPGDTLYLRGGTYYERLTCRLTGTREMPITIRSFPGELAIVDGGIRAFFDDPANAWIPLEDGATGEFVSAKAYPDLDSKESRRGVAVLGNFADSMIPLHGYHSAIDLRTDSMYSFDHKTKERTQGFYSGPGLWWNPETGRIHCRLAHTNLDALGRNRYRGETDPRKLQLVVAGGDTSVLSIDGAKHIRFQDLVVRGSRASTVSITRSEAIELDGLDIFGGSPALHVTSTAGLRVINCAVRGLSAPWSSRSSMKYFGNSPYLVMLSKTEPLSRDIEFAYSEFTDSHDGLFIGAVDSLDMHHCLVDNHNDDGIYITAVTKEAGNLRIHENRLSRSLSMFSFYGSYPPFELGKGVYIARNVIDLRPVVHYEWPTEAGQAITTRGRLWGEHGSPIWEPLYFFHNTVLGQNNYYGGYYAMGLASHISEKAPRRIFNNIFVVMEESPGIAFPQNDGYNPTTADLQVDGNLFWSPRTGPTVTADYFESFRKSKFFEPSKNRYNPGWTARDLFLDPGFIALLEAGQASDLTLQPTSPAIDSGVDLPKEWPDPLRVQDNGPPDRGAIPSGTNLWPIGVKGRISVMRTSFP